ncbi:MAG: hypothetical protein JNM52_06390, partial [Betaproteobacteria bacterium]|nr:hypothetical protein [Betaproteobacteria bacterium]
VQYTINGIAGQKNISRQPFGTVDNTAGLSVKDLWWAGAAEDGWGISIAQQYRTLFAVWYTYCPNGKACWFVMPGGVWNSNTYVGTLYTTTSSSWLGASYNPAALSVTAVGTLTLTFIDANNATMNYQFTAGPYAGTNQTKTITRQPF